MNLFILTTAVDKTNAAVVSVTDPTPVTELQQLMLGDSEPFVVKFTDGAAAPAWAGDPAYNFEIGLGGLDTAGGLEYTTALDFDPITGGWSGRLNLDTQRLRDAITADVGAAVNWSRFLPDARTPRVRSNISWQWLQFRVVDPAGNKVTYAQLRVAVFNRVLANPPVENDSFTGAIQQTLDDEADISWDVRRGPWAIVTITDNRNFLNPTNRTAGQVLILEVRQAGGLAPTFGDQFIWPLPDSTPPASTGLRQVYSFACTDDGKMLASMIDFAE